eukprot:403071_1
MHFNAWICNFIVCVEWAGGCTSTSNNHCFMYYHHHHLYSPRYGFTVLSIMLHTAHIFVLCKTLIVYHQSLRILSHLNTHTTVARNGVYQYVAWNHFIPRCSIIMIGVFIHLYMFNSNECYSYLIMAPFNM